MSRSVYSALDYWWDEDNLGDTCDHTFTVVLHSPLRFISALTLFDRNFLAFINGRSMLPFSHEQYYHRDSFPFKLKPFKSTFQIKNTAMIERWTYKNEWKVSYSCNCDEPMSLFCQSLIAVLTRKWFNDLRAQSIPTDPLPVHFDRYVNRTVNHCWRCHRANPLSIIDSILNMYHTTGCFAQVETREQQIIIHLPKTHRYFRNMSCFIHLMKSFPYPVLINFS